VARIDFTRPVSRGVFSICGDRMKKPPDTITLAIGTGPSTASWFHQNLDLAMAEEDEGDFVGVVRNLRERVRVRVFVDVPPGTIGRPAFDDAAALAMIGEREKRTH
jgi:hypothetical protein